MVKTKQAKNFRTGFPLTILGSFTLYSLFFFGKIYPGISLAGVPAGGKDPASFSLYLSTVIKTPDRIRVVNKDQTFEIEVKDLGFSYDFTASTLRAYDLDRTGNFVLDFYNRLGAFFRKKDLGLVLRLNEKKLESELAGISEQVAVAPVFPSLGFKQGRVVIEKGKTGKELDIKSLRLAIGQNLAYAIDEPIKMPLKTVGEVLSDEEVSQSKLRAEKLTDKTLVFNFDSKAGYSSQVYSYKKDGLFKFINPEAGYDKDAVSGEVARIASEINRPPKNPVFVFSEGKVKEFRPADDGIEVEKDVLEAKIYEALRTLEGGDSPSVSFNLPVTRTPPEIKTGDVNNLGIRELVGRGVSRFRGSITSRIHNLSLAASRLNGILVKPGEIFSFNEALGDVSAFAGYQQAYIIREGKTILGDGGGVCQVSTTLFRAILNAGLPVVERRAHSYRVGYYEQDFPPGFDATVYSPSPDLKFKNDTPGYLLIQSYADAKKAQLVFEIYGTSDGRVATTTKPRITDQVEPPPDLYQDDPTLPAGRIKQIDYKAWGAKVVFNYKVERAGETIYQKVFVSNYQPWQAVYLRGTGPVQ